jgi:LacI family transcriptional regulator
MPFECHVSTMPRVPEPKPDQKPKAANGGARRPTLKTIAGITGLAVTTVSRALNDAPDIGLKTRQRVRKVADEVGYIPDRAGVRLRTGRTSVISLVLCTDHDAMNHTAKLISSIASALRGTQYHLIITPYFLDEDPMRPIRYIVENRTADAVIMNRIQPDDPRIRYLTEHKVPFVTHGRSNHSQDHSYFDFDNTAFGTIAVTRLAARGRSRLLMVAPPVWQTYAQHMIEGARAAAATCGVEVEVLDTATSDDPNAHVHEAVRQRLAQGLPVDGLICGSMTSTMAAVAGIEDQGLVLARDIDVFAKEGAPFLRLFRKDILTAKEDVGRAGTFIAQAAIKAINEPDAPPMQGLEVPTMDGSQN